MRQISLRVFASLRTFLTLPLQEVRVLSFRTKRHPAQRIDGFNESKGFLSGRKMEMASTLLKRLKSMPTARRIALRLGLTSKHAGRRTFLLKMLPTGSVGAEIGVHRGDFSERILSIVKPVKLHLIDPWKYESSEAYKNAWYGGRAQGGQAEMDNRYAAVLARFRSQIVSGQVFVHRSSSEERCGDFPDDYFDWVYIDGNHLYEFVKKDLELYYHKVRRGGYLMGDDYAIGGSWKAGVKTAVDEFLRSTHVEVVDLRNQQFIIRKLA
jgi:hypothetical protein